MNYLKDERLGRKYIGLLTLFAGLFIAWIVTNVVDFKEFQTLAEYLFKGYAAFCGANTLTKIPGFVKDIKQIQAERKKKNGSQKSVQVDQTGSPDRGRDSSYGLDGEGNDDYPEGGPGACEP